MSAVTIYTDGSSRGNPGVGGWGAIILTKTSVRELGGANPHTTNNRMEMQAVIEALTVVLREHPVTSVELFTDSSYVCNGALRWVSGWEQAGWLTRDKKPVLNQDLWEMISQLQKKINITWSLVKGHAGNAGNERCDVIATSSALGTPVELYTGPRESYSFPPSTHTKVTRTKSSQKAFSYVSLVAGKVTVHQNWSDCEKAVKGKSARFKKVFSKQEEDALVEQWKH
jgi:ribonuclease HI